jgi:thiol-disulfide isomerase/thioredoxin
MRVGAIAFLLVLLAAFPADAATFALSREAKAVPAFSFTDQDGKPLALDAFRGKVVVIDYWATWCPPCRAEFPMLDRLQASLGPRGLAVVPISLDRGGRQAVDAFYRQLHIASLGEYLDPTNASSRALGLSGLPTALVIDRQGREVARVEGAVEWDSPAVRKQLEGLLDSN